MDLLKDLGPLPDEIIVHLDAGYDSGKTRQTLADRGLSGQIAHKGEKAPIQATSDGMLNAQTHGTTRSTGSNAATNAASG